MKFVLIVWYDAYEVGGWFSRQELDRDKFKGRGVLTYSAGWLFHEDEHSIVLVQSWQPEQEGDESSLAGVVVIPVGMVIEKVEVPIERFTKIAQLKVVSK